MTSMCVPGPIAAPKAQVSPEALSKARVALILAVTIFFAVGAYYFVGVDEGMTSVFGKSLMVHEWVHDSRHFLGFPCH